MSVWIHQKLGSCILCNIFFKIAHKQRGIILKQLSIETLSCEKIITLNCKKNGFKITIAQKFANLQWQLL